ncbi:malto-oligosyltrehalose trehalohydrolase [Deinococcus altitudinis]|uniref:malto-oligosyltrehalose trehalohydrolase n=1 Tax=Deinococcus altitudinis TaxID=468914 RepID=UPI0038920119
MPLEDCGDGIFEVWLSGILPGTRYKFELDGQALPDPYARWCPEGVHAPAEVWEPHFTFLYPSPDLRREELVIYEVHLGTFTPEGTYRAAQQKLADLHDLGVTAVELMPLTGFPGRRGWGCDGVTLFAPFAEYGTPEELMAFIDEAHRLGLAVFLDLILNHFGPDGNFLAAYSPAYFTSHHKTPWGDALDYGEAHLRRLVLDAARHWLKVYRFDGLRLDATHEIFDESEPHILEELAAHLGSAGTRAPFLFCEDDRNDPALVTHYGMDGLWADDFHHQVHVLLTGEQDGYYRAYRPQVADLARCIERGWLYEGQTWPLCSGQPRGRPADPLEAPNLVYCLQNHDQIGNRAAGERLHVTAGPELYLAASMLLLFLPATPLLFQGQEWMASAPFLYFADHTGELGRQISEGRQREFRDFETFAQSVPDPQAETTFAHSVLDWDERSRGVHARSLRLYQQLLHLRRDHPVLGSRDRQGLRAGADGSLLWVMRRCEAGQRLLLVNFSPDPIDLEEYFGAPVTVLLSSVEEAPFTVLPGKAAAILHLEAPPQRLTETWARPGVSANDHRS